MNLLSSKRRVVAAAALIVLALFLLRPGVSRLKAGITASISRALARPVETGSVHLRFLPRPGFDLENLIIYEDSAFGAEPMLRAREVTAVVRLTSLARGKLDVARLELTEPSLNLVRRGDGRWNWQDLLERTERTPLAPTAKAKSETRAGFPYIEATAGRINFKTGPEKKPYALLNADFALWQESENTWGARLRAEPLRTDMSMSDTGVLRMNATWQRSGSLRETPLQVALEWDRAQLGQLTKLVSGTDKGWRGEVRLDATLLGSPAALRVAADASILDFHRYDILSSGGLRLAAHCDGTYSSAEALMREILCRAPVGDGMITLHGDAGVPGSHRTDLALNLESVSVASLAALARRAKKNLPADLASTGNLEGQFTVTENGLSSGGAAFQGRGQIIDLHLQSTSTRMEFATANVPFVLTSGTANTHDSSARKPGVRPSTEVLPPPSELRIEYGPFPVALGRPVPAQVRGWVTRSGYTMLLRGEGEVGHTLRLASLLGLPAIQANVEGGAQMELQISGSLAGNILGAASGFSLPQATGNVQLRNVRAKIRGVNQPIEISSAELQLLRDEARLEKLNARAAGAVWTGSLVLPRGCGTLEACVTNFNLSTDEVGLAELSEGLRPPPSQRPWYQMLTSNPVAPSFLQELRASGVVKTNRLRLHHLVAGRVSVALDLERGKLSISQLQANVLGGKHTGYWRMDFTTNPPAYTGTGTLIGISLQQLAEAMHDSWISGTASGTYQLQASGADSSAFWKSAEGALQFEVRDGALPHIALAGDEPLRFTHWQGHARLRSGKVEFDKGVMLLPTGAFGISGSASLAKELNFKLSPATETKTNSEAARAYTISGTLAEPHVTVNSPPETQAKLKP